MAHDTLCQGIHFEVLSILGDLSMTAQAIVEFQQRPAVRLMTRAAIIIHRRICGKGFAFQLHRGVTA